MFQLMIFYELQKDWKDLMSWFPYQPFIFFFMMPNTCRSVIYVQFSFLYFLFFSFLINSFFCLTKYTHVIFSAQFQRIIYPSESEGSASTSRTMQKTSIKGTIWSMCFISLDSRQPSKEHNPVLAIILNKYGD
jgi:hypothetical protein